MSANAIETLTVAVGCAHPVTGDEHDVVDAAPAALAAVEELYEAASRLSDPTHQLTQLEWNGVMSRLRAAVARVETGQ